uniref:Uncharacterized protein n=1 Tax=Strongyloides papillosus TaxID=174720 RepID=A0A0N5BTE2_STREA
MVFFVKSTYSYVDCDYTKIKLSNHLLNKVSSQKKKNNYKHEEIKYKKHLYFMALKPSICINIWVYNYSII